MNSAQHASAPPAHEGAAAQRAAAHARKHVLEIARRHFGEPARRVRECGGGLTNAVYQFKVSQGEFIVRMHQDPIKIQQYLKEQWAMDAARGAGVPTPSVLEVGNFGDGHAYMIAERVRGIEGALAPQRLDVLERMGHVAAKLHRVRTHGFGSVFDWSSNSLSKHDTWAGYLTNGFDVEGRIATLQRHDVLTDKQARWLRHMVRLLARSHARPGLHHGDLRLKNVLVDPVKGSIVALIDWESCASMPGPAWDLSLALHDLGIDEKEAFLRGYGMSAKRFASLLAPIRCFNMLNYTHAVLAAAAGKRRDQLAWFRLRMAGALDVFER